MLYVMVAVTMSLVIRRVFYPESERRGVDYAGDFITTLIVGFLVIGVITASGGDFNGY